jgi:filamentous hemagglutinin family protein
MATQAGVHRSGMPGKGPAAHAMGRGVCYRGRTAVLGVAPASALPQGGVVQAGAATIKQRGPNVLDIVQSTPQVVINWLSFSIEANERVNFSGPSASAAALNLITGTNSSVIRGQLTADGQVFTVNLNGVLYGKEAAVTVGGLVTTTAIISTQNFMAGGNLVFSPGSNLGARIVNHGDISVSKGGLLAFVAPGVENSGVIQAPLGSVALGSADAFTLDPNGNPLIALVDDNFTSPSLIDAEGQPLDSLVSNSGAIRAIGGSVLLAASTVQPIVSSSIDMSGVTRAKTANSQPGQMVVSAGPGLAIVSGTLDASGVNTGEHGGNVEVLGNSTQLAAGSLIDLSGDSGGGIAAIGTTLARAKGGPSVSGEPLANTTTVAQGGQITADALTAGNGGVVTVLSQDATSMAGTITARGGSQSGDGGLVEISGGTLSLTGAVDVSSANGIPGTLLLDPYDFMITRSIANALTAQILAGNSGELILRANHDIEVDAAIDGRGGKGGTRLVLTAGNQIRLNANVLTNNAPLEVDTGAGGVVAAPYAGLCAGTSSITVKTYGSIITQDSVHRCDPGRSARRAANHTGTKTWPVKTDTDDIN